MNQLSKFTLGIAALAMLVGGLSFVATQTEWLQGAFSPALTGPTPLPTDTSLELGVTGLGSGSNLDIDWSDPSASYKLGEWRIHTPSPIFADTATFTLGTNVATPEKAIDSYFTNLEFRVLGTEGWFTSPYPYTEDAIAFDTIMDTIWTVYGSPLTDKEDEFIADGLLGSEIYASFSGERLVPVTIPPAIIQGGDFSGTNLGTSPCSSLVITSPTEGEVQQGLLFQSPVNINATAADGFPYDGIYVYDSTDENSTFDGQIPPYTTNSESVTYVGQESGTITVYVPEESFTEDFCLDDVSFELEVGAPTPLPTPPPEETPAPEIESTEEPEEPIAEETPAPTDSPEACVSYYYYEETTSTDEGLDVDTIEILTSESYVCEDPFLDTDLLEDYISDLICRAYEANFVDGRDADHYKPSENMTRAEFLKLVLRSAGYLTSDADGLSEDFADVSSKDWFLPYVVIGYNEGFVEGEGIYFRPNDPITRADATLIGMRVADVYLSVDDNPFEDIKTDKYYASAVITAANTFVDVPGVGEQAVVQGYSDGNFHPLDYIARDEAAVLANRMALAFFLEAIQESIE